MGYRGRAFGTTAAAPRGLRSAKAFALGVMGVHGFRRRWREIRACESKLWRGRAGDKPARRVFRVRCLAGFGCGPHDRWEPEQVLWTLLSLDNYRCPYHR